MVMVHSRRIDGGCLPLTSLVGLLLPSRTGPSHSSEKKLQNRCVSVESFQ